MMKPEFLEGFPRKNSATTCRHWVNYVVALAGLSLWEKKGMRESDMQEHILADYKKYFPIACEMYEEYMPIVFKESGALMRPVFGKACEEWTGVSLLRKFKEVVKRDIMNVYNRYLCAYFLMGNFHLDSSRTLFLHLAPLDDSSFFTILVLVEVISDFSFMTNSLISFLDGPLACTGTVEVSLSRMWISTKQSKRTEW
jgi:hypothetical protein